MADYFLREQAQIDLEQIWFYTFNQWGVEQADIYLKLLLNRFSWLAKHPLLGKNREDIKPGYRSFPEGMHLIFYTVSNSSITIIGIVHQSMDVADHI